MKTLLSILLVGMALVLFSEVAQAQGISIRGAKGCGKWVEDEARDKNSETYINTGRNWLLGYLSGLAITARKDFWGEPNVNSLDNNSVYLWIDNYCRANPLKTIDYGADALFLERTRGK